MRVLFKPLLLLLVGSYPIYRAVVKVTDNFLFKVRIVRESLENENDFKLDICHSQDPLVAKGPCPSCGTENRVFFGDVLGVGVRAVVH